MPTKFFDINFYDNDREVRDTIDKSFGKGTSYYINKYNQYFNRIKFPFGRYIRIEVSERTETNSISNPLKGAYWAIDVLYNNFDMQGFFQSTNNEKKEAILTILQNTSKAVCEKFNFEYAAFDICFKNLLASNYLEYHKKVSKIFVSPSKQIKAWFEHEIELSHTDIFLRVENKSKNDLFKIPIYLNNDFGDTAFSYLDGETFWLDDRYLEVRSETKEVIHIIDIVKRSFEVKFAPKKGWSEKYLSVKLQQELSKTHDEWKSLNTELNAEFRKLQEQFWVDHSR